MVFPLASDVGVSVHTIKSWTAALEAIFSIFLLPAYSPRIRQQVIKSPKLFFTDTGLMCYLMRISSTEQLWLHPLRGEIFENYVIGEIYKEIIHRNLNVELFFYKESRGIEIDLLIKKGQNMLAIEIKSTKTFNNRLLNNLLKTDKRFSQFDSVKKILLYDGEQNFIMNGVNVMNFRHFLINIEQWLT
jgi:predicted AAA+ superfamily ATPase